MFSYLHAISSMHLLLCGFFFLTEQSDRGIICGVVFIIKEKRSFLPGPSADIQDSQGGTIPTPNGDSTLPGDQPDRNPQHFAQ